jgi:hypothetical protein
MDCDLIALSVKEKERLTATSSDFDSSDRNLGSCNGPISMF